MPALTFLCLILCVIAAAGLTIAGLNALGLPMALLAVVFSGTALGLRLWLARK